MKLRVLFLALSVIAFSGCASYDPKSPVVGLEYQPGDDDGRLRIYRTKGYAGSGIPATLSVNGESFVKLNTKDFVEVGLPKGDYLLSVIGRWKQDEVALSIKPHETKYLLVTPNKAQFGAILVPIAGTKMKMFLLQEITESEYEESSISGVEVLPTLKQDPNKTDESAVR